MAGRRERRDAPDRSARHGQVRRSAWKGCGFSSARAARMKAAISPKAQSLQPQIKSQEYRACSVGQSAPIRDVSLSCREGHHEIRIISYCSILRGIRELGHAECEICARQRATVTDRIRHRSLRRPRPRILHRSRLRSRADVRGQRRRRQARPLRLGRRRRPLRRSRRALHGRESSGNRLLDRRVAPAGGAVTDRRQAAGRARSRRRPRHG